MQMTSSNFRPYNDVILANLISPPSHMYAWYHVLLYSSIVIIIFFHFYMNVYGLLLKF